MALHLLKLCVGVDTLEDLQRWSVKKLAAMRAAGEPAQLFHTTRMVPKRVDELLDGGALYWVIKGNIEARQQLENIVPFVDGQGIRRCHLMLSSEIEPTARAPRRPFQGWRYLKAEDAPPVLSAGDATLPPELRRELAELGLL
ncbi:MAG: DUF1489 family protein [Pseudomonadota bacterium]